MNNYAKLYWLTRLDYLQGLFTTVAILLAVGFIIYHLFNEVFPTKKSLWLVGVFVFISSVIACLIPNKNEAILIMAGGKTMDYIQQDSSLSKVPYQTTAIISEYLDKTLKEMKEKK